MIVTVLELPATWGAPERVLAAVEEMLAGGPRTDLVLLPEASLTGYVSPRGDFDLRRFAEPPGGPTSQALSALAARRGVALAAPVVLREGDACFNAVIVHDASGRPLATYRKRHPWFPEKWATPGPEGPPLFQVGELAVTLAICFDGHFLEDEEDSCRALSGADLLLFPSAWLDREDSRTPLLSGIARRFGISIAGANWAPGVVRVPGMGDAYLMGPDGEVLARAIDGRADAQVGRRKE
ncbi:MAG TPA: carbon-nitrogen hydrolase family protein [Myxococcaceae bacterium]